jgi:hypothetical protein
MLAFEKWAASKESSKFGFDGWGKKGKDWTMMNERFSDGRFSQVAG